MNYILRNLVLLHVLLLALFLTWVHGGTRADHLQSVPWLMFLIVNVLVALPPTRKGESLPAARRRVWRGIVSDPLLYLGLSLSALLAWQWLNGGHVPVGDVKPELSLWLPFSAVSAEAVQQLYWFPPVFLAVLAVRQGVPRAGQRRLLKALVWGGALLSVLGWIQRFSGTQSLFWLTPLPSRFFATFGYENHAGEFFTLLFAVSGGLWFHGIMDKDEKHQARWLLVPAVLNLAGVFGSLSRAAMLLSLALLVGGSMACIWSAWKRVQLGTRVKALTFAVLITLLTIGVYWAFPEGSVRTEMASVQGDKLYADTIGGRFHLYRSAWSMIQDYPVFGVGGWGYRHLVQFYVTPVELEVMTSARGQANVHNDVLQFLAEHGLVGFGLMLASVVVLLVPVLRGAWRLIITPVVVDWDNAYVAPLLRVPAVVYGILAGTAATVIHSMIDLPFRSPAILITWALCLACAPAFLPRPVRAEGVKG